MHLAQFGPGFHPELVAQHLDAVAVDRECVRLSGAAEQRRHQLHPEAFPQRVCRDQPGQFGDQLLLEAECEVGLDPALQGGGPGLLPLRHLGLREEGRGVGQRDAVPELQRRVQQGAGPGVLTGRQGLSAEPVQPLVLDRVDPGVPGVEGVSRLPPADGDRVPQLLPQPGHIGVDLRVHRRRRLPTPERPAQPLVGDHLAPGQQECREHGVDLRSGERNSGIATTGLDRPEYAELHADPRLGIALMCRSTLARRVVLRLSPRFRQVGPGRRGIDSRAKLVRHPIVLQSWCKDSAPRPRVRQGDSRCRGSGFRRPPKA